MKKGSIVVAVIAVLIGGFFLFSKPAEETKTSTKPSTQKTETVTSFSQVSSALTGGAQLLDVRTAEEYTAGHIESATNFTLQDLQAGKMPSGAKSQKLYLYCHSGNRSGQAATILKGAGFTNVIDLGAITHVQDIGGKLVTGS